MGKRYKEPEPLICSDCAKKVAEEAWMEYSQAFRDKVLSYQSPKCESCGKRESAFTEGVTQKKVVSLTPAAT